MIPNDIEFLLSTPFYLDETQIDFYRKNQFIKLKSVLDEPTVGYFNTVISKEVKRLNANYKPLEECDTYGKAFIQLTNLWQHSETIKSLVFSRRLASIATQLMETQGVRLYHDQALFKEAGGGITPWHADQYYWPLSSDKCTTAWIPLQKTDLNMGPLEFSAGSHIISEGRELAISDESEIKIKKRLRKSDFEHVIEPFDVGEISFHSGWIFHRAGANQTEQTRKVMTIIYMDQNMKLKEPENDHQKLDRDVWCPGAKANEVIQSPLNPVLFSY